MILRLLPVFRATVITEVSVSIGGRPHYKYVKDERRKRKSHDDDDDDDDDDDETILIPSIYSKP